MSSGQDVYLTCIPDLWRLRDTNGDGTADERTRLSSGYGLHVGFLGHDLHGLIQGPDGKLYFSIGDRGLNATGIDGRHVVQADTGSILRCEPDGSQLEIVATGLRNPQELAFNEFGNLFTVDNNSDSGDRARIVHVVPGGDSGWRIGWQFITYPNSRGPWNAEKMWHPRNDEQPAFLVPPVANLSDGPSGLAYNPGTGLGPDQHGRFFLADFRGSAGNSGIRSFALKPHEASYALASDDQFLWRVAATDVAFGPDGDLYLTDWVDGWNKPGKGRIYRVTNPRSTPDPLKQEVATILAEGLSDASDDRLVSLLSHADMRIRLQAQFTLADHARASLADVPKGAKVNPRAHHAFLALSAAASNRDAAPLTRRHAIWGLGQVERFRHTHGHLLVDLLTDPSADVRAKAARVLATLAGEAKTPLALEGLNPALHKLLNDDSPRVRFAAAIALGKVGDPSAFDPLLDMADANLDSDPYLRHAAVMGLIGTANADKLAPLNAHPSPRIRMTALLALRRLQAPSVSAFLEDTDPQIVLEAARAISDVPILDATRRLSTLPLTADSPNPLARRVISACLRVHDAERLAELAADLHLPETVRVEALDALAAWPNPPGRDWVTGLWHPIEPGNVAEAQKQLAPIAARLLADSEPVARSAAKAIASLRIASADPALLNLVENQKRHVETRIQALQALDALHGKSLPQAIRASLASPEDRLRAQALGMLARLEPDQALPALRSVLETGSTTERQAAFAALGSLKSPLAGDIIQVWLDRLPTGKVPPAIQLDLLEAAAKRPEPSVRQALETYRSTWPKNDPLAPFRATLEGGDSDRGRQIFLEKAEVACLRCHKVRRPGRRGRPRPHRHPRQNRTGKPSSNPSSSPTRPSPRASKPSSSPPPTARSSPASPRATTARPSPS